MSPTAGAQGPPPHSLPSQLLCLLLAVHWRSLQNRDHRCLTLMSSQVYEDDWGSGLVLGTKLSMNMPSSIKFVSSV